MFNMLKFKHGTEAFRLNFYIWCCLPLSHVRILIYRMWAIVSQHEVLHAISLPLKKSKCKPVEGEAVIYCCHLESICAS